MQPKKVVKIADAQKRRPATRAKNQKSAQVSGASRGRERVRPRAWVRDTLSVLIFGGGVFLLLSVLSHAYHLALAHNTESTSNLMGTAGQVVAARLFNALGVVSLVPIVGLVWLAFFRLGGSDNRARLYPVPSVVLACFTFIVSLAGLISLATQPFFREAALGGSLGSWSVGASVRGLGLGGSSIAMALVAVVSLAVILQRSIGDVAHSLRFIAQGAIIALCLRLPIFLTKGVLIISGLTWGVARRSLMVLGRLFVLRTTDEQEYASRGEPQKGLARRWALSKEEVGTVKQPQPQPQSIPKERSKAAPAEIENPVLLDPPREVLIVKPQPRDIEGASSLRKGARTSSDSPKKRDEVEQQVSINPQFDSYEAPAFALLTREESHQLGEDDNELRKIAEQIELKLKDFNIAGRVTQVHPGPVITLFEFEPAPGVKVGRIAALQDDLAMSLKASSIRIIAPLPKRGTVGIEVPNKHRAVVRLRECLESAAFASAESTLSVPLGKDTYGETIVVDIASMPHLLMAGATGTGKSVSINALLLSLLYRAHPAELGLILIDPKVLELSIYEGIPHLRVPVVTDPRQAKGVLSWAVKEMDRRYRYMQKFGVRNIDGYNRVVAGKSPVDDDSPLNSATAVQIQMFGEGDAEAASHADTADGEDGGDKPQIESIAAETLKPLPKLVIVIDELADLMLSVGREIEELITRLAQKARAAGIHLIVATQRPSVDVITGLIKANFPARLSFRVSSRIDSRTILDSMGAEKLLGKGDMLFMLPGAVPLKRVHGAFVSDQEVQKVVNTLKANCKPQYDDAIIAACDKAMSEGSADQEGGSTGEGGANAEEEFDPFYDKAVELVMEKGQASTSMIQRAFRIGYNRAARIIDVMEREGVVGKTDGVRPREVIVPSRVNVEEA